MSPAKRPSRRSSELESAIAAAARRLLGRNLVACVLTGSRANDDALPDSDADLMTIVRDTSKLPMIVDYPDLVKRFGIRIGTGFMPESEFLACARGGRGHHCCRCLMLLSWRLGRARLLAGRDVFRDLPPPAVFLERDLNGDLYEDYWWAVLKDSPANVWRREPRRHVGIIIAVCTRLLLGKGITGKKDRLPALMRRHFPRFPVVRLLRRALDRRSRWAEIEHDPEELRAIRADLREFLARLDDFSGRPGRRAADRRATIDHINRHRSASRKK